MTTLEAKLRAALAHTRADVPRPVTPIELPLRLDKLLSPRVLRTLKPASVLVPVMRRPTGLSVLLTLRSEKMRSHGGQISFPGGRREPTDASAAAAALREAHEEAGIPLDAVEVVGYLDDYPTVTRYLVTPVVGLVDDVAEVHPCVHEVAEIFEVPLAFVIEPKNFERKLFTAKGMRVPFLELNYGKWRIWGATAGMLWNLSQKVSGEKA